MSKSYILIALFFMASISVQAEVSTDNSRFKIKGDSSSWDIPNNQMKYFGNAQFSYQNLVISGDQIVAQRSSQGTEEIVTVTGSPANFNDKDTNLNTLTDLSAESIRYELNSKTIIADKQVHLIQKNQQQETIDILGNRLRLEQREDYRLSVSGTPVSITISQANQTDIQAKANQVYYDKKKDEFELSGDVTLTSERETMTAEKVIYNMKSRFLQVPKSDKGQVEIIQTKSN